MGGGSKVTAGAPPSRASLVLTLGTVSLSRSWEPSPFKNGSSVQGSICSHRQKCRVSGHQQSSELMVSLILVTLAWALPVARCSRRACPCGGLGTVAGHQAWCGLFCTASWLHSPLWVEDRRDVVESVCPGLAAKGTLGKLGPSVQTAQSCTLPAAPLPPLTYSQGRGEPLNSCFL